MFKPRVSKWLAWLLLAAGLTIAAQPIIAAAPNRAVEVVDARGKTLRLEQPARRLIALAPHLVENLFSAGAGDHLLAAVDYSDYPEAAKSLPRVGSYNTINYEAILAYQPDLVLVWLSGNGPEVADQLERLGLNVYVDEPRSLDDIAASLVTLGQLAGTETEARQRATTWQASLEGLRNHYRDAAIVTVFYQIWNNPLQTLNGSHLVSDVMQVCGGRNIFADTLAIAPIVGTEAVLSRNPDTIIASGMGEERPLWLDAWQGYTELTAVKHHNLFYIPADLIQRHTLRLLEGTQLMCEQLDQARQKKTR